MAVKVHVPAPVRTITGNRAEVEVEARTVEELIQGLERLYPGIKEKLCDSEGKIRRYLNVYVNDKDARTLGGEKAALRDGDEVSIIPAIAGGRA